VIWGVFENMSQSNSRFKALDNVDVNVHSVNMPVGFRRGNKTALRQGTNKKKYRRDQSRSIPRLPITELRNLFSLHF